MGIDLVQNGVACSDPWFLLDHCEEAVIVTDSALRVIYSNKLGNDLFSGTSVPLIGHSIQNIFPDTDGDCIGEGLRQAVAMLAPRTLVVDTLPAGSCNVRVFGYADGGFALFLRAIPEYGGADGFGVREKSATYPSCEDDTYRDKLEVALEEREAALREFERGREFQRRFLAEVLANVTEGRLCLCSRESDLPALLPVIGETFLLTTPRTLAPFRRGIEYVAASVGIPHERTQELIIAAGEAAMNGIVHAGGGTATLHGVPGGARMQICLADCGSGIADDNLHRATLERGYTTAGSLGFGFSLMHAVADRVYLLTRPSGTIVILEQNAEPEAAEDSRFQIAYE